MNLHLVIMAGGSGTRFWPKSTSRTPKQLLSFGGDGSPSLLSQTLSRFDGLVDGSRRIVVTTKALESQVAEQAPGVTVLAEPMGRNTAPCVYWAAREIAARDPEGVMLVMPADHYIPRPEEFRKTVAEAAARASAQEELVTLGIRPVRPETGYGYLRLGPEVAGQGGGACRKVEAFVEKPDLEKAKQYVASGQYLWNGGMFLWRASVILAAFDCFLPQMRKAWDAAGGDALKAYPELPATSVDYGIMEKVSNVVTFPLDCGWDDVGSWISLEGLSEAFGTAREGAVVTGGEVIAIESRGNIVDAPGRLVALLGVEDLIVVEHGGALLVARKDLAQDIRKVVDQVKKVRPDLA